MKSKCEHRITTADTSVRQTIRCVFESQTAFPVVIRLHTQDTTPDRQAEYRCCAIRYRSVI